MRQLIVVFAILTTGCAARYSRPTVDTTVVNLINFAANASLLQKGEECTLVVRFKNDLEATSKFPRQVCEDAAEYNRIEAQVRRERTPARPTPPPAPEPKVEEKPKTDQ